MADGRAMAAAITEVGAEATFAFDAEVPPDEAGLRVEAEDEYGRQDRPTRRRPEETRGDGHTTSPYRTAVVPQTRHRPSSAPEEDTETTVVGRRRPRRTKPRPRRLRPLNYIGAGRPETVLPPRRPPCAFAEPCEHSECVEVPQKIPFEPLKTKGSAVGAVGHQPRVRGAPGRRPSLRFDRCRAIDGRSKRRCPDQQSRRGVDGAQLW